MNVSVVGLGKLGLPMAAVYATKGHHVIGLDNDFKKVAELKAGQCPIFETNLETVLQGCNSNINYTMNYDDIAQTDISFVIVPTPSGKDGKFTNVYIQPAIQGIAEMLRDKQDYHLVVVTSTVMPGTMTETVIPILEGVSGKLCNKDFGVCYNPEFIALGSVIKDMQYPDAILIGESDNKAGQKLAEFHRTVIGKKVPIHRMSLWTAEVAKLSLNVFVTTKISLANTFADICKKIPDGDIDALTTFLGDDSRIGKRFFKGGLGFGGECFPRDNRAFIAFADGINMTSPIQEATDKVNKNHTYHILQDILNILIKPEHKQTIVGSVVTVLGVTYKPNTPIVTESTALDLVKRLTFNGVKVRVYDPMGNVSAKKVLDNPYVKYLDNIYAALDTSELCILATPWAEFEKVTPELLVKHMQVPVVYDCWRFWDKVAMVNAGVEYHAVGLNNIPPRNKMRKSIYTIPNENY